MTLFQRRMTLACVIVVGIGLGMLALIFLPGSWAMPLFVVVVVVPAIVKRVRARRGGSS